jgi:3-demethoxyubiquinol 3-hydroxylase
MAVRNPNAPAPSSSSRIADPSHPAARNRRTIARILKVNHAGEYGAIRIYRAQIWLARRLYPDVVPFLEETLSHEVGHCAMFENAMPERAARPCRAAFLWGNGGLVLGFLTALIGREGIWVCTAAVEGTVHKHLDDQLFFLRDKDPALHSLIAAIQDEELHHLNYAAERIVSRSWWVRPLSAFIGAATEMVIWLSTWGDSTKMARELAAAKAAG